MPPHQTSAISNGVTNGTPNGSASNISKQKNKSNGVRIHPRVQANPVQIFSGRFGALFAFVFLGSLWAAVRFSSQTPGTYALCSQDGNYIYTVDVNNTNVQCVVVRDAHILDTGSLCTSSTWRSRKGFYQLGP